ncbi:10875_t:CDS:2 [Cetraspora pellucida]|uniref:10875_t:CDS:1 n=1 Tax=Cetraspora pellucida TaxID=1433469 RepID=A0A9N8ZQQ4_9GLOM|nr:10875_t:CDS:2 [Cetraspora pellucida]
MDEQYSGYNEDTRCTYFNYLTELRDVILKSPPFLENWNELDGLWHRRFVQGAENASKKIGSRPSSKKLRIYWEEIIQERKKASVKQVAYSEKENLPLPKRIKTTKNNVLDVKVALKQCAICQSSASIITLLCLVRGDTPAALHAITVKISKEDTVGKLKEILREQINAPTYIKAKNLQLWKIEIPDHCDDELVDISVKDRDVLLATRNIEEYWTQTPPKRHINVIILPPTDKDYIQPCSLMIESNNLDSKRQRILCEQNKNIMEICKMPCPSVASCPRKWEICNINPLKIFNLRPSDCRGPPVALFHPVFSQFLVDKCNCKLNVPADLYIRVSEFSKMVGQIYQDESKRQEALRPFFASLFDGFQPISFITDNGAIIDDVLLTDNTKFGEKAAPVIWEYKNEIGTSGKDLLIQAGCEFAKYWAQFGVVKIRKSSCCPSIIIAIAGPWICILGGIYLEKPVIEPLTDFIFMIDRPEDDGKRVGQLAIFFEALRLAYRTLDNYYKNLSEPDEIEGKTIQRFFPYRNHYQVGGNEVRFIYLNKLTEEPANFVWKAETNEGKTVIIKFTKKIQQPPLERKTTYSTALLF